MSCFEQRVSNSNCSLLENNFRHYRDLSVTIGIHDSAECSFNESTTELIEPIEPLIHTVRGQRVMLDRDLAAIYGVTSKRLNEQVRRNRERFPDDFMFQLSREEEESLRSQIATLGSGPKQLPVLSRVARTPRPSISPHGRGVRATTSGSCFGPDP